MSNKKKKDDGASFDSPEVVEWGRPDLPVAEEPIKLPEPEAVEPSVEAAAEPAPAAAAEPEVLMTFDRWFATTKRPAHHKGGMLAFIGKVKGKRSVAKWEELFKAY